jgi:DNA-binding XRE family transcriptional regulator
MYLRTLLPYTKIVRKPRLKEIPLCPQTVVEHICKVRLERGLSQHAVGRLLGLSKDCVSLWETGRNRPKVSYFPRIFAFLGYYPMNHETESIAGKLQQLINCNGWNHTLCAKALGIDSGTVKRLLRGQKTFKDYSRIIIYLWAQLPDCFTQYRSS